MLEEYIIKLDVFEKSNLKQKQNSLSFDLTDRAYYFYVNQTEQFKVKSINQLQTEENVTDESYNKVCLLSFSEELMFLQCLSEESKVFVNKTRLKKDQIIYIGESLEFYIEHIKCILTVSGKNEDKLNEIAKNSFQDIKNNIYQKLLKSLNIDQLDVIDTLSRGITSLELVNKIKLNLKKIINETTYNIKNLDLEVEELKQRLESSILDDVLGMGPIEPLLKDDSISEIMVNGVDQIFIEKEGSCILTDIKFDSELQLTTVIQRMVSRVGRRIDKSSPIVDARLLDGSRINAVLPPISIRGPLLTIRKFPKRRIGINDLINYKSISTQESYFLKKVVEARKNLILSGGTSSGKTTLLNVLSSFIPNRERIITIEDSAELQLKQTHVIPLECRASNTEGRGSVRIRDLVKNSLRMRPDRIIVGECRGEEAIDMLQAMNTGHDGSMTSVHANSAHELLFRLETMVLMGSSLPLFAIRQQISTAVKIIVYQKKNSLGKRMVSEICWLKGLDKDGSNYITANLFYRSQLDYKLHQNLDLIKEFCEIEEIFLNQDDLDNMRLN